MQTLLPALSLIYTNDVVVDEVRLRLREKQTGTRDAIASSWNPRPSATTLDFRISREVAKRRKKKALVTNREQSVQNEKGATLPASTVIQE